MIVKRQVTIRPSVPRPEASMTQPTVVAFAAGDGLELQPEQEVGSISAAYLLCRIIE
jgi:hypothetical protein